MSDTLKKSLKKFIKLSRLSALLTINALLLQNVHAAECKILSPRDMIDWLELKNPTITSATKKLEASSDLISSASALPNPELEYGLVKGDSPEGEVIVNEIAVGFEIELGGKRGARTKAAKAQAKIQELELSETKFNSMGSLIISWFRYKENKAALDLYGRALKLFRNYLSTISNRSLSPSQKIEKKTIELAIMDISLLKAKKQAEQQDTFRHISLAFNNECDIDDSLFSHQLNLPNNLKGVDVSKESLNLKQIESKTELFQAMLDSERSNSYPNITIGPSLGIEQSLLGNQLSFGVQISTQLPVFNLNRAGRRASFKLLEAQKILESSGSRDLEIDLQAQYEKYNGLLKVVQGFPTSAELINEFSNTERLFRRGVISSSLLLESQRKFIEFIDSQTQFKVEAIETLLEIYKSTNQKPEQVLM